jgi:hypothetical protein
MRLKIETRFRRLETSPSVVAGEEELSRAAGGAAAEAGGDDHDHLARAVESVLATMNEQHRAHVVGELEALIAAGTRFTARHASNLTRQFYYTVQLAARESDDTGRLYGLPPSVAQIYLDNPEASALDRCTECHSPSPALLALGRVMDLPLHPSFNAYRLFVRCQMCGAATGGGGEPYYLWAEVRRVAEMRRVDTAWQAG